MSHNVSRPSWKQCALLLILLSHAVFGSPIVPAAASAYEALSPVSPADTLGVDPLHATLEEDVFGPTLDERTDRKKRLLYETLKKAKQAKLLTLGAASSSAAKSIGKSVLKTVATLGIKAIIFNFLYSKIVKLALLKHVTNPLNAELFRQASAAIAAHVAQPDHPYAVVAGTAAAYPPPYAYYPSASKGGDDYAYSESIRSYRYYAPQQIVTSYQQQRQQYAAATKYYPYAWPSAGITDGDADATDATDATDAAAAVYPYGARSPNEYRDQRYPQPYQHAAYQYSANRRQSRVYPATDVDRSGYGGGAAVEDEDEGNDGNDDNDDDRDEYDSKRDNNQSPFYGTIESGKY